MRPRAAGWCLNVNVRLIHAQVRRMILCSGRWDADAWGAPINQHDELGTSLLFSVIVLEGLRQLGVRIAQADATIARTLDHAIDVVADELLLVDEEMTILDYEIGVGLFRRSGDERNGPPVEGRRALVGKKESDAAKYRFSGEYWSDELADFVVEAEDRCVR